MTNQEFINTIAPLAQKYAKQYGYKIVSAAIAQACLESAYGTSPKAKFHNYFGLKYRQNRVNCNNGYFLDGGSEQSPDGTYTPLPSDTAWYSFEDIAHGVEGYYQFINIPNYAKVKETSTPLAYLQAIKDAHYATSLDYVQNVFNVVTKWNLTQYDNLSVSNNNQSIVNNKINIIQKTNINSTTIKNNRNINWIVLHYTAGTSSSKNAAQNTAAYFAKAKASADFIVDDNDIVQYNPDLKNRYCWSVGGAKYSSLATSLGAKYYGQCQNNNSISIEMCSKKINTSTLNANDDDWYITDATINNTIKLTKYLMQLYNIDINHVIMHHMVTGKWCPQPWCKNENALTNWYNFLNKLQENTTININTTIAPVSTIINGGTPTNYTVKVNTDVLNIRSGPGTMYSIVSQITSRGIYTIVAEENGFGKLKSGIGWIDLNYTIKNTETPSNATLSTPALPYTVKIIAETLNVRSGPGTEYPINRTVHSGSIYTIVEEQNGFGKLKSGAGWISLKYIQKT